MGVMLKSVLQNQWQARQNQLSLFLKSIIFGSLLAWTAAWDFSLPSLFLFILGSVAIYARPLFQNYSTGCAFLVLLPAAILGMRILEGSTLFWPGIFIFSFIFHLLAGVKNYFFIKRSRLYYLAALLLFYSIFIEFFLADKSELFWLKYGAAVFASFLLFLEWLKIISTFSFPQR